MRKLERRHTIIDSLEGFLGMLLELMKKEVEATPRDGQAGFRQQRSCSDQMSIPADDVALLGTFLRYQDGTSQDGFRK